MNADRRIPFAAPFIGPEEKQAVLQVLEGTTLTHGPRVKEFEAAFAQFTGAPYAVATASCTASLHLACLAMGIGPGDEVIVPAQTHVATAHAVELCGAKPVFVDSERATGNLDIEHVEARITERTKAIFPVHYLGLSVDMNRITSLARKHGLRVVEDCAMALGTRFDNTHAGLHGDAGCFSFYPAKHITTAEGGMFITRDPEIASAAAMQRAFGIDRNVVSERHLPGAYDVVRLGLNYRMNEIGAALGLAQLARLPGFLVRRRENLRKLTVALQAVEELKVIQAGSDLSGSSCYCLVAILRPPLNRRRALFVEKLKYQGVETSVYYPHPVPLLSYYQRKYGGSERDFPIASRISAESVALPVGPQVSAEDIGYLVAAIKQTILEVKSYD